MNEKLIENITGDTQKLEDFLYKEYKKEDQDAEHPFSWYVFGVLKGLQIATVFLIKDEEE